MGIETRLRKSFELFPSIAGTVKTVNSLLSYVIMNL